MRGSGYRDALEWPTSAPTTWLAWFGISLGAGALRGLAFVNRSDFVLYDKYTMSTSWPEDGAWTMAPGPAPTSSRYEPGPQRIVFGYALMDALNKKRNFLERVRYDAAFYAEQKKIHGDLLPARKAILRPPEQWKTKQGRDASRAVYMTHEMAHFLEVEPLSRVIEPSFGFAWRQPGTDGRGKDGLKAVVTTAAVEREVRVLAIQLVLLRHFWLLPVRAMHLERKRGAWSERGHWQGTETQWMVWRECLRLASTLCDPVTSGSDVARLPGVELWIGRKNKGSQKIHAENAHRTMSCALSYAADIESNVGGAARLWGEWVSRIKWVEAQAAAVEKTLEAT